MFDTKTFLADIYIFPFSFGVSAAIWGIFVVVSATVNISLRILIHKQRVALRVKENCEHRQGGGVPLAAYASILLILVFMVSCRLASSHTQVPAVPISLHVVQTTIAFSGKIEHYSSSLDVIRLRRGLVHKNLSRACFCTACLTKFHSGAGHGLLPCPLLCHHVPSEVEGLCLEEASLVGQVAAGMGPKEEGRQPGPRCLSASFSSC